MTVIEDSAIHTEELTKMELNLKSCTSVSQIKLSELLVSIRALTRLLSIFALIIAFLRLPDDLHVAITVASSGCVVDDEVAFADDILLLD